VIITWPSYVFRKTDFFMSFREFVRRFFKNQAPVLQEEEEEFT